MEPTIPNRTKCPSVASEAIFCSQYEPPIKSKITSTPYEKRKVGIKAGHKQIQERRQKWCLFLPFPSVIFITSSLKFFSFELMTCWAPFSVHWASFSSVLDVAMTTTLLRIALANCIAANPTELAPWGGGGHVTDKLTVMWLTACTS